MSKKNQQTLFDVSSNPVVKNDSKSSKKKDSSLPMPVELLGINESYRKYGHVLTNRNNKI